MRLAALFVLAAGAAPASAEPGGEFLHRYGGAEGSFGVGTQPAGDDSMGELGAAALGIRTFDERRWVLQWNGFLGASGGGLANTRPFFPLVGGAARAEGELGYRLRNSAWSPYAGLHLNGELQFLASPGVPASRMDTLNGMDGFGGLTANAGVRLTGGASRLAGSASLLLVGFVQEALRAPRGSSPGAAFLEGGVGARVDLAPALTAQLEAAWGGTPVTVRADLGVADRTAHGEIAGLLLLRLTSGRWLGLRTAVSRDSDHAVFLQTGTAYDTALAPVVSLSFLFGVPL